MIKKRIIKITSFINDRKLTISYFLIKLQFKKKQQLLNFIYLDRLKKIVGVIFKIMLSNIQISSRTIH